MSAASVAAIAAHIQHRSEGDWGLPDGSLLHDGLAAAPDLPLPLLRSWGPWIANYAAMMSAPQGYAFAAVLGASAAAIGAARMVEGRPGWRVFPALWVLLVGPPSALKTPILSPTLAMLKTIERDEAVGFAATRRDFETKLEASKAQLGAWASKVKAAVSAGNLAPLKPSDADAPDEPKPPRIVANDATIEAMAPLLKANPRGILLARDELAGFIGNIGKYGGDGDAAFWLERFDGEAFSTDRVKTGHVQADVGLVSILGGIQPERLQEVLLSRADDGFTSRFIMIYPEPVPRVWITPVANMDTLKRALTRLRALVPNTDEAGQMSPVVIPLNREAQKLFAEWWVENGAAGIASVGYRAGMLGKAGGLVLRLSLILELLEWAASEGAEPTCISHTSVAAAIGLFEDYILPSTCRALGGAGRDQGEAAAAGLLKQIRHRGARSVNAKEIYRSWSLPGLTSAKPVSAALEALSEAGWVRRGRDEAQSKNGRPPNDWAVNPLLWEVHP